MLSGAKYRGLSSQEIGRLEESGSAAEDWSRVLVAPKFDAGRVRRCRFAGEVRLGEFSGAVSLSGASFAAGVYDSFVCDSSVGDNALVERVGMLRNYDVEPGACVCNCDTLTVEQPSAFGNGVEVSALNESGGRTVPLCDRLSAQLAYLLACYRHRPALVTALRRLILAYTAARQSARGRIGSEARVCRCGSLREVWIGDAAEVIGALDLRNGSILSSPAAPTAVGAGVMAEDFIVSSGCRIDRGAVLNRCFVGQGCRIDFQFSGKESLFFANSEFLHGEAVSTLAGPYTVSHHKSTLLIAGFFSFYNAGAGTSQSNHMYKLGPVHQGILERGSKTGSFSYLLWPARIGPFSTVIGKHYSRFDIRDMPFSIVRESGGLSELLPGRNLFSVGMRRDGGKWLKRDRRAPEGRLDLIRHGVFTPFTAGRMLKAIAAIHETCAFYSEEQEQISYRGLMVRRSGFELAEQHYALAAKVYFGAVLADRLERQADPAAAFREGLAAAGLAQGQAAPEPEEWVDILGLLAPQGEIDALCVAVESGTIGSLEELESALAAIHDGFEQFEWRWTMRAWERLHGKPAASLDEADLRAAVVEWRDAALRMNNLIINDAAKEFSESTRISFGIDGGDAVALEDFKAVRGSCDRNEVVAELRAESETIRLRAGRLLEKLRH